MTSLLPTVCAIAEEAGGLLRERFYSGSQVTTEDGRDIKLNADVEAEALILRRLREAAPFPVLSEESGADTDFHTGGDYWVVDPLDGTLNFSRGIPLCCVSIAMGRAGQPLLGVVHDFLRRETFAGVVGEGATCNGVPLEVSATNDPAKAVLATGFPSARDFESGALMAFCRQIQRFKKVRLLGSAALSLAWLAAGRLDAYAEDDIWLWDVAAGLALVAAAGGRYEMTAGSRPFQQRVQAWNRKLSVIS